MTDELPVHESIEGEPVSAGLRPLLERVYAEVEADPVSLPAIDRAMRELLTFLVSPEGRTNANCWATDLFFCVPDHWKHGWVRLPLHYRDVLDDMGHCLHDTVQAPEIAANFGCTPEQLLQRLESLGDAE